MWVPVLEVRDKGGVDIVVKGPRWDILVCFRDVSCGFGGGVEVLPQDKLLR